MWYVIDAEPGAELIFGFEHPVTKEILKEAVANGTLDKHLHKIKIQKGDVIYVPAGTVHGIGAGALIAEIQESSSMTTTERIKTAINENFTSIRQLK